MKSRSRSRGFSRIAPLHILMRILSPYIFLMLSIGLLTFSALNAGVWDKARVSASDGLGAILFVVTKPVQEAALFVRDVSGLAEMQAENIRLKQENMRLRQWYQSAMFLNAENKELKDLLHAEMPAASHFVSARILADSGNAYVKSILVSAGKSSGVEKGHAVMAGDGLIGRITEAGHKTARVLLITDVNSRVPVLIEDTMQHAVMAGTNDRSSELVHLPQGSEVEEGSRIITSGYGGVFPYGLPVGVVYETSEGRKMVRPFTDLQDIVHVRIVKTAQDPNLREGALKR